MAHHFSALNTDAPSQLADPPIHSLPPELLCDILINGLPSPDASKQVVSDYYGELNRLRVVCRLWREIIDDSPPFWPHICCTMPEDLLETTIHNSKEREIAVYCSCRDDANQACRILHGIDSQSSFPTSTTARAAAHCRRWESLSLDNGSEALIQDYLNLPLPSLGRLSIRRDWRGGAYNENSSHLIFGGENARLVELSLERYRLPWSRLVLDELRSIHIGGGQHVGKPITANELLQLLSRTPILEHLSYRDCSEVSELTIETSTPTLVLKKMQLPYVSTSLVQGLCRSMVPHPSGVEIVHMEIIHRSQDGLMTFFRDVGRIIHALSRPCNAFRLSFVAYRTVEAYALSLDMPPIHIQFRDAIRDSAAVQALNTIFGVCSADLGWVRRVAVNSVSLRLYEVPQSLVLDILQQANTAFPEIMHLELSGIFFSILPGCLQQLGTLMPSMMELEINTTQWDEIGDEACEALEEFLRSRPLIEKWSLGEGRCSDADIYKRLQKINPPGTLNMYQPAP